VNQIILPGSYLSEPALSLPLRLWLREGGRCHWCGRLMNMGNRKPRDPRAATCDHIVPRALGGSDEPGNQAGSCKRCNQLKGSIPPERFERILQHLAGDVPELGTEAFREIAKALASRGG
jgi:5-methylcytosine-specific restriction endonuclease McrA